MKSLAHLRATVIQQDGAVRVDLKQRPSLIEVRRSERDAELYGSQCESALDDGTAGIPVRADFTAITVRALGLQPIYELRDDVVFDRLPVVRYVSMRYTVEIRTPHIEGIQIQGACDIIEN